MALYQIQKQVNINKKTLNKPKKMQLSQTNSNNHIIFNRHYYEEYGARRYKKSSHEILAYNQRLSANNDNNNNNKESSNNITPYWNFFPTPEHLIQKMLEDYITNNLSLPSNILEPSAGKGDIIKFIINYNNKLQAKNNLNLFCFELVKQLRDTLKQEYVSNNLQILGSDFLQYHHQAKIFDLIVMNPPFDRGVEHVLHAFNLVSNNNGEVIALLNKHSYYNAYNIHRLKLKALIDNFGSIENLGQAFNDKTKVQRTARVDVILIKLKKNQDLLRQYREIGVNLGKYCIKDIRSNRAKYEYHHLYPAQ